MAIYVMSDLHGNYDKYKEALSVIEFKDSDTLYVLGDVIDRGEDSMKILMDMWMYSNIVPILGNHEYMAMKVLQFLMLEINENNIDYVEKNAEVVEDLQFWSMEGGDLTIAEFNELDDEDKHEIIEYLNEFRLYEEVEVGGKCYVLVHAGLDNFDENRPMDDYEMHELIFNAPDYNRVYFTDKYLVTGHVPTFSINEDKTNTIYRSNNHIAMDGGVAYGGKLAVIRLDDGQEFYI